MCESTSKAFIISFHGCQLDSFAISLFTNDALFMMFAFEIQNPSGFGFIVWIRLLHWFQWCASSSNPNHCMIVSILLENKRSIYSRRNKAASNINNEQQSCAQNESECRFLFGLAKIQRQGTEKETETKTKVHLNACQLWPKILCDSGANASYSNNIPIVWCHKFLFLCKLEMLHIFMYLCRIVRDKINPLNNFMKT